MEFPVHGTMINSSVINDETESIQTGRRVGRASSRRVEAARQVLGSVQRSSRKAGGGAFPRRGVRTVGLPSTE